MRRAAAALAALAVLAAAAPVRARQAGTEFPVRVQVGALPAVVHPGGTLTVPIDVVNTGAEAFTDLQVRLYVGSRVETRDRLRALDEQGAGRPRPSGAGYVVDLGEGDALELSANATLRLPLSAPVDRLPRVGGGRTGVYPVRIEVRARIEGSRRPIAWTDTYLQLWPRQAPNVRMPIAWVWPLVETPRRDVDGVYPDDVLGRSLASGGRLDGLLDAAVSSRTPVTWAVDPALVAAARDLGDGYRFRDGDEVVDGEWRQAAADWYERLTRAVADRADTLLAVPYADPDVVALVRHGQSPVTAAAARAGRDVLAAARISADATLAWPPSGVVDTAALDAYAANGARVLVLSAGALTVQERNYTPAAATALRPDADLTGLVVDEVLQRLVDEGPGEVGDAVAVQRFLAETAVVALERPNQARAQVVAPSDRQWAPGAGFAELLLRQTAAAPWLRPVGLRDAAAAPEDDGDERFLTYPGAPELDAGYLGAVGDARGLLGTYEAILPREPADRLPAEASEQLLRAVSAQWRRDPGAGRALAADVDRRLRERFGKVRISTGGLVTLTSDTGRIPITVINELEDTVRVRIRLDTRRLDLTDDTPIERTIPPGRTQLTIEGRAVQAGEFTISVALFTPDDKPLPGGPAVLRVRSTAYGRVALVVTVGAFVVLLVAGTARLLRRRHRSATAAAA